MVSRQAHNLEIVGSSPTLATKNNNMARPTTTKAKQTLYRNRHTKGVYRINYQAPSGAGRAGIPKDDLTDLITLEKVSGPTGTSAWIFTSEADLKSSFEQFEFPAQDTPEGTGTTKTQPEK